MRNYWPLMSVVFWGMMGTGVMAADLPAPDCNNLPTCADLGYNVSLSSASTCNGKYFPCPFDAKFGKCDETATVGDIKYSTKSSAAGSGWLKCDGSTFSATKYPELYNLIGTRFGTFSGLPKLPDYRGIYLRGAGTLELEASNFPAGTNLSDRYGQEVGTAFSKDKMTVVQPPTLQKHRHSYSVYAFSEFHRRNGGYKDFNVAVRASGTAKFVSAGSGTEVCPLSVGLVAYIYAGAPAN